MKAITADWVSLEDKEDDESEEDEDEGGKNYSETRNLWALLVLICLEFVMKSVFSTYNANELTVKCMSLLL